MTLPTGRALAALAGLFVLLPGSPALAQEALPNEPLTQQTPAAVQPEIDVDTTVVDYGWTHGLTIFGEPGTTVQLLAATFVDPRPTVIRTEVLQEMADEPGGIFVWELRPEVTTVYSVLGANGEPSDSVLVHVRRTATIGISQANGIYTFSGAVGRAEAGVQVTVARLDAVTKRVTGVASTRTTAGGRYVIRTSLPVGQAGYYTLTDAEKGLIAGRSRLYGLVVPRPAPAQTVSLNVGRAVGYYIFNGAVSPGRSVPVTLARNVGGRLVGVTGGRTAANGGYVFRVPVGPGTHFFQVITATAQSRAYGLVVPKPVARQPLVAPRPVVTPPRPRPVFQARPASEMMRSPSTRVNTSGSIAVPTVVATAAPASAALGTGVTQRVLVSDPTAYASKTDYSIHEAIVKMVDETPAGGTITHLAWNITYTRFADALIRAHKRGVTVYVAQNGEKSSTQMDRVRTTIGSSRWHICRTNSPAGVVEGCLSTRVNSYMHAKALTFSKTGTKSYVVVDGTTNMTNHGYENNDMLVTAGDYALYDAYRDWFSDAFNLRKNDDYLKSTNGTRSSSGASAKVYFSPQADSIGGVRNEASTDIMALTLKRLTPTTGCSVKFMERYVDNRSPVMAELVRVKRGGCYVKVISDTITQAHIDTLVAAGIPVRKTERTTSFGFNTQIHHKNFVMEGTIDGVSGRRLVAMGSQNVTWSSHRFADESYMVLTHGPTVDVYERTFDKVDATSYRHPGS